MKDVKLAELYYVTSVCETHWSFSDEAHGGGKPRKLPELQSGLRPFRTRTGAEVTPGCP